MKIDLGYRLDILVEDAVIVVGLLINFNVKLLKDGITRRIN
jgi:hypothetical protein